MMTSKKSIRPNQLLLLLAYLYTISLTITFINWEATPYNLVYAFIQSAEIFFILLIGVGICEFLVRKFIRNKLWQFLTQLIIMFSISLFVIRLNVEFTQYNVEFVLQHSFKVFFTLGIIAVITRLIVGKNRYWS